jgi:tRNA CCA-adding enzyme
MDSKIKQVLDKQILLVKPDKEILDKIEKISKEFCKNLKEKLKSKKIEAEVFIGGSIAKGTLIKKKKYDIDLFVRFSEKYKSKNISELLKKIVGSKGKKVHGSRDYFKIKIKDIEIELIPVLKIKKPEDAENITDLSYFHVNYVLKQIKNNKNLNDEIRLAKAFAHAQNSYGAEGYIHGFSGYSLELLISYYKSFYNFIKAIADSKNEKIIIDPARFYRNKNVLMFLNESKTQSPIILIDPTNKDRNALAGLNNETFEIFKKACIEFIKNPNNEYFITKNIDEELRRKYKNKLKIIKIKSTAQKGDIAGTKSKKFFEFLVFKLEKEFNISLKEFSYDDEKNIALSYFILESKEEEIVKGPPINFVENLKKFKKVHPNSFIKDYFAYVPISHGLSLEQFLNKFKKKEKTIIKAMKIKEIKVIKINLH